MIKFFRKIRKELLNKNKVGKYLLYAFGEIILVIIGILIALNLNQRSEQKKAEAKIDAIFEDVLIELKTNINNSTPIIYNYQQRDSLASLVLNTDLTYDDYANKDSRNLWRIATSWSSYDITFNAYNVLMTNIDAIPEKYSKAVFILNGLHTKIRPTIDKYNKKIEVLVDKNFDEFEKNYTWYSEADYTKSKEAIDYRLHDYRYKNMVKRVYGEAVITHRTNVAFYRTYAIECYKEIASVLNKSLDSISFLPDVNILEGYVGTYIDRSNPESKAEIYFEDKKFHLKSDSQSGKVELVNLSSETEFAIVFGRGVVTFSKNNSDKVNTMTIHIGHTPVTYTKINP